MIDAVAVLPVRLDSRRIPGKALVDLAGKPMLWHVWRQVLSAGCFRQVVVATNAEKVANLVESWGGKAILTPGTFGNGTERIASIAARLKAKHIVNVQADMPRIEPRLFHQLLQTWDDIPSDLITPIYQLKTVEELLDPNVVKVIRTERGIAAYFSRQAIPYSQHVPTLQWLARRAYWGHIGIYGATSSALEAYGSRSPSSLEIAESLEQLRFLEIGIPVATFETTDVPMRVDGLDDLARAREFIAAESGVVNSDVCD